MTLLRRLAPAIVLVLIAPLIGEFLIGSTKWNHLEALPLVVPLYGFGALFIREVARQNGRGWPTMIALALVYGIFEEGFGDFTLFTPNFLGFRLLDYGYIPSLGMGGPWTVFVLTLHVVSSICIPIATVELLFVKRRTQPWLGRPGLAIAFVGWAFAVSMLTMAFLRTFQPAPHQVLITVGLIVVGLITAIVVSLRKNTPSSQPAPSPLLVGLAAFLGYAIINVFAFFGQTLQFPATVTVVSMIAAVIGGLAFLSWAARRTGWCNMHRFALVFGFVLVFVAEGVYKVITETPTLLAGQLVIVAAFGALLYLIWKRLRSIEV